MGEKNVKKFTIKNDISYVKYLDEVDDIVKRTNT